MTHITHKGTTYDLNALVDLLDRNKALYDEIGNTVEYDSPEDDLLSSAIQALANRTLTQETLLSNSNATINKVHASFSEALTKIADGKEASIRAGKKPHNYTIILDRNGEALVSKNGFLAFLHVMFCGAKYDGGKVALKEYANHEDFNNRHHHLKKLTEVQTPFRKERLEEEINALSSDIEFLEAKLGEDHPKCKSLSVQAQQALAYLDGMQKINHSETTENLTAIQKLLDAEGDFDSEAFDAAVFKATEDFSMTIDGEDFELTEDHAICQKHREFIESAKTKAAERLTGSDVTSTASLDTETDLPFEVDLSGLPSFNHASPTTVMGRPDFPALPSTPQQDNGFDKFVRTVTLPGVAEKKQTILADGDDTIL